MEDNKKLPTVPSVDPHTEEMLRGTLALGMFRDQLEERGFRVPADYKFRVMDKGTIDAANSAVFSLMGGVPAFLLWASENPNKFYELFMKSGATSPLVNVNANKIEIVSALPANPLDDIEIDSLGVVKKDDDVFDL
jgi:hypothetical protein